MRVYRREAYLPVITPNFCGYLYSIAVTDSLVVLVLNSENIHTWDGTKFVLPNTELSLAWKVENWVWHLESCRLFLSFCYRASSFFKVIEYYNRALLSEVKEKRSYSKYFTCSFFFLILEPVSSHFLFCFSFLRSLSFCDIFFSQSN